MTREEAIKIISNYEELGCGFCHEGGDEVPQAFEMAVKALEETGIKPPCGVKELLAERKKTNQQMLATISAAEFLAKIEWLFHDYGKRYADSNLAIMEWLDSEVENDG